MLAPVSFYVKYVLCLVWLEVNLIMIYEEAMIYDEVVIYDERQMFTISPT